MILIVTDSLRPPQYNARATVITKCLLLTVALTLEKTVSLTDAHLIGID